MHAPPDGRTEARVFANKGAVNRLFYSLPNLLLLPEQSATLLLPTRDASDRKGCGEDERVSWRKQLAFFFF